jgi:hypothetical protein
MNALEFSTKIEQGMIYLPKQFQEYNNTDVRIIVLIESKPIQVSKKEKLLATFKKMQHRKMFATISDPVQWQKQLRDEWE